MGQENEETQPKVINRNELEGYVVDAPSLAALFNVSLQRVYQIVQELGVAKRSDKTFSLMDSVSKFCAFQRSRMRGPASKSGDAEKDRNTTLTNELLEIKLAEQQGKLVPVEDVEKEWEKMTVAARQRFLAIPTKAAPILAHETEAMQIQAILEGMVREALLELTKPQDEEKKPRKSKPQEIEGPDSIPIQATAAS